MVDIGDSLTQGAGGNKNSMTKVTSKLLGDKWDIDNMGVGGENTLTIGARYGAIPMYIEEPILIPKTTSKIEINCLKSMFDDSIVKPLILGKAGVNPCYIDGIKCKLTRNGNKYYINRVHKGFTDHKTKPKTIIETNLSRKKYDFATIFIGQNKGYNTPEDLLHQIDLFVKHKGDKNIIIITSHGNGDSLTVAPIAKKYKNKHIDLKKYMSSKAIYDAIDFGLLPNNGKYPTKEDLDNMKQNLAPKSLLHDNIHFNSIGYELLGRLRYKKGIELGYW